MKTVWRNPKEIEPIILSNEDEWFNYRCGKITASDIWRLMSNGQVKDEIFSEAGKTYILQNLAEIITGDRKKIKDVNSFAWGKKYEPDAAKMAFEKGHEFEYYGGYTRYFFPYNAFSGASPDGLNDSTIFEIKCPYTSEKHVENLLGSLLPNPVDFLKKKRNEYLMQIYFNMLCTGRKEGIFISYDPRATKESHRLAIIKVPPDHKVLEKMIERIEIAKDVTKESLKLLGYEL